jgi:hypothetical protein
MTLHIFFHKVSSPIQFKNSRMSNQDNVTNSVAPQLNDFHQNITADTNKPKSVVISAELNGWHEEIKNNNDESSMELLKQKVEDENLDDLHRRFPRAFSIACKISGKDVLQYLKHLECNHEEEFDYKTQELLKEESKCVYIVLQYWHDEKLVFSRDAQLSGNHKIRILAIRSKLTRTSLSNENQEEKMLCPFAAMLQTPEFQELASRHGVFPQSCLFFCDFKGTLKELAIHKEKNKCDRLQSLLQLTL